MQKTEAEKRIEELETQKAEMQSKVDELQGKIDIEITVELIKLPIYKDETSSIGINISAEPIE